MITSDHSRVVTVPGQDDNSMSPTLVRLNNNHPDFLRHPATCGCLPCDQPRLHVLVLQLMMTSAWSLMLQEAVEEALQLFSLVRDTFPLLLAKTKAAASRAELCPGAAAEAEDSLRLAHLRCLLQEAECLLWQGRWDSHPGLDTEMRDTIAATSPASLDTRPELVVWCEELRVSVAANTQRRLGRERRLREEAAMVTGMAALDCGDTDLEDALTPDCSMVARSRIGK